MTAGKELIHDNKFDNINEIIVFQHSITEGLNEYALEEDLDLMVVHRRKRSFLQNLFHKSETKDLTIYSALPLLVIHEDDKSRTDLEDKKKKKVGSLRST